MIGQVKKKIKTWGTDGGRPEQDVPDATTAESSTAEAREQRLAKEDLDQLTIPV